MGSTYDRLDERLRRWVADQRMFFVATAPSGPGGRVNLSPKGHADTFVILDERTVADLDLTGSGADPRGYAVLVYQSAGERDLLGQWTQREDDAAIAADRAQRNTRSVDDLPALPAATGDRQAGSGRNRV